MSRFTHKDWVTDEEDRGVIPHQVPISFFRVELDCEPTWVPSGVSAPGLASCKYQVDVGQRLEIRSNDFKVSVLGLVSLLKHNHVST